MIDKLKKYLYPRTHKNLVVKDSASAKFNLLLDDITVGYLTYQNNVWQFEYSPEFKELTNIKPLADFPDLNKVYKDNYLWPFFSSRIPSLARNRVKTTIKEEGIRENDVLGLLQRFGSKTITNPFILVSSNQNELAF